MRAFSVILLAAGGSNRPGRHKLLQPYLGRTLVEHSARNAIASGANEVIVVVGDQADEIRERLRGLPVRIVRNRVWAAGISGSIRCGMAALDPGAECTIIALADQPRITPGHLRELARRTESKPIAASSYDGVLGAPCAFDRSQFDRLLRLQGPQGAGSLIREAQASVAVIDFDGANDELELPPAHRVPVIGKPRLRRAGPHGEPNIGRSPPVALATT